MSKLPATLSCDNGHTFAVPKDASENDSVDCPDCGCSVPVVAHRRTSKGRSLWTVMQSSDDEAEPEASAPEEAVDRPSSESTAEDSSPKPRSLWSVVESAGEPSAEAQEKSSESGEGDGPSSEAEARKNGSDEEKPRGLWAIMSQKEDSPEGESAQEEDVRQEPAGNLSSPPASSWSKVDDEGSKDEGSSLEEIVEGDDDFEIRNSATITSGRTVDSDSDAEARDQSGVAESQPASDDEDDEILDSDLKEEDEWQVEDYDEDDAESQPAPLIAAAGDTEAAPVRNPGAVAAYLSLGLGIVGALCAGLNLLPGFLPKIPSTLAGLGALVWSYQSLNESKRSPDRGRLKLLAGIGLGCGLVGMFAGPMFLNAIGDGWREEALRTAITQNLDQIGEGVEVFYGQHGAYPRATYVVEDGLDIPMHSWQSALLPHMGYDQLALKIDRKKTFDDPANFEAMSTVVPTFLVPNVDHKPTGRGLATTHFAGVGGETLTTAGQVDVGAFSKGRTITHDMLTDGASQTMLAGEITRALPAWGEPGNWRVIGRGLNRQVSGFGNAAGTGAHFLMADGSVKFFPNATSKEVLIALSTRNAGDSADE